MGIIRTALWTAGGVYCGFQNARGKSSSLVTGMLVWDSANQVKKILKNLSELEASYVSETRYVQATSETTPREIPFENRPFTGRGGNGYIVDLSQCEDLQKFAAKEARNREREAARAVEKAERQRIEAQKEQLRRRKKLSQWAAYESFDPAMRRPGDMDKMSLWGKVKTYFKLLTYRGPQYDLSNVVQFRR